MTETQAGAAQENAARNKGPGFGYIGDSAPDIVSTTELQALAGYIEDALPPAPDMCRFFSRCRWASADGIACRECYLPARPPRP
jgi:hypothetical protein